MAEYVVSYNIPMTTDCLTEGKRYPATKQPGSRNIYNIENDAGRRLQILVGRPCAFLDGGKWRLGNV